MPLSRIIVGVDFSPESRRAVDHALAVARRAGAALTLVHVGIVPDPPGAPRAEPLREALIARLADDRARLADLRERLSGHGVEISHAVVDGHPDPGLAEAARELHADLVVVGTHGRTGFRRLLLGSIAERTARLADTSVLIARGDAPAGGYRRIVVGTDFSPLAQRAVEAAVELAAPGAEVRVVHAWTAPYAEYGFDGHVLDGLREGAEAEAAPRRAALEALARAHGVRIRIDLIDGTPGAVLEAASGRADLVAVGSHGRRGARRLLLGSVAETTIRHAHCAVLVAR